MSRGLLAMLLIITIIGSALASRVDESFSIQVPSETDNYESSYTFSIQNGYYQSDHTLYVSVPPSLREYYYEKAHLSGGQREYAKFVTPGVVKSMAENIRNVTGDMPYEDEEFANVVLTIVREIPYARNDAKYPVETITDNEADCDGLSILAASIMKAGGLDVVLLLYEGVTPSHMNVGVCLEKTPVSHSWWVNPSGVDYNNKTYWIAECTSLAEWTVGDRPQLLSLDKPLVIPLEKCEKNSPGSVSSTLDSHSQESLIYIDLSLEYADVYRDERIFDVSGSISPAFSNETIALYVNQGGYSPTAFVTATDEFGNYTFPWNVTFPGTYNIMTSWSGSSNYSGRDSETLTVYVGAEQPLIELLPGYYWDGTSGEAQSRLDLPSYAAMFSRSSKEFLNSSLRGTDVVLSGDFMVLSDGNELVPNETTYTIPAHREVIRLPRSRRTVTVQVPEKTVALPGIEQFNNQFGFILQRNEADNYTASVKVLTDNDVSQITQSTSESKALFMNVSEVAKKNTWNRALAKVSSDEVAVEVFDVNGTRLDWMKSSDEGDLGLLSVVMTYVDGQILAFKNLKIETFDQSIKPSSSSESRTDGIDFIFPYIRTSLMLAGVALAVICWKERRGNRAPPYNPR